jgi:hypothetical protein
VIAQRNNRQRKGSDLMINVLVMYPNAPDTFTAHVTPTNGP